MSIMRYKYEDEDNFSVAIKVKDGKGHWIGFYGMYIDSGKSKVKGVPSPKKELPVRWRV